MKRVLIRLLVASCCLVALSYAAVFAGARGGWAPWTLAIGANGVLMSLMAIGAVRRDTLPRSLVWTFGGMFVFCAGCFVAALALPAAEGANGPLLFGLPLRTAIVLYGIGVVPIFILPFAYALTFESSTLSEADLHRVRTASAAVRAEREAA
ncbi:MAG TPA: hypothetical protein VFI52_10415 [Gemmatimonadaceae bacterium]|nr:hypothetical protein [Gemmatimonadaceae bacterium]